MWAFFDFGLLMPALVPAKVVNRPEVLAWTNNGEYELQVRGRLREHLQYFMDNYMEAGTFNPVIQATPDKDYNFRFYTTREAYAEGIKQAALKMDYEKFKNSSDRFDWNKKYHTLLTRIWGTLCELAPPGGIWGPRSNSNPKGYDSASEYLGWGYDDKKKSNTLGGWYADAHDAMDSEYDWPIGTTFGERAKEDRFSNVQFHDSDETVDDRADWEMDANGEWVRIPRTPMAWEEDDKVDDYSWMTESDQKALDIINELDELKIAEIEWVNYCSPGELAKVVRFLKKTDCNTAASLVKRGIKNKARAAKLEEQARKKGQSIPRK